MKKYHPCTDSVMKRNQVKVQEECDPEVYGENAEKKLQSIINSIGDQSALFLIAVGDCIGQQEVSS